VGVAAAAYNEHLTRDVGSSASLTVVLAAAAVTGQWLLSVVAIIAAAVYAYRTRPPCASSGLPGDAVARMVGITLQLVLVAIVAWLRGARSTWAWPLGVQSLW
jgi:hypothetical protein